MDTRYTDIVSVLGHYMHGFDIFSCLYCCIFFPLPIGGMLFNDHVMGIQCAHILLFVPFSLCLFSLCPYTMVTACSASMIRLAAAV